MVELVSASSSVGEKSKATGGGGGVVELVSASSSVGEKREPDGGGVVELLSASSSVGVLRNADDDSGVVEVASASSSGGSVGEKSQSDDGGVVALVSASSSVGKRGGDGMQNGDQLLSRSGLVGEQVMPWSDALAMVAFGLSSDRRLVAHCMCCDLLDDVLRRAGCRTLCRRQQQHMLCCSGRRSRRMGNGRCCANGGVLAPCALFLVPAFVLSCHCALGIAIMDLMPL